MAIGQYRALDLSRAHLARTFAEDILATLEPGAVLLASGDHVVLPVTYLQAVEGQRPDVTLVMLGPLTHGEWYAGQLRECDRNLIVPFDRYDPHESSNTLRALIDANPARQFALMGPPPDTSLENDYWYWPRGLVLQIEPRARDVTLTAMAAENDRLLRGYRSPGHEVLQRHNFDPYLVREYATPARLVGVQYLAAQMNGEARAWFNRALAIDPDYPEAQAGLAKSR